jgi:RNA polymerase sigma-70 factor (ECF subfamily)
MHTNSTAEFVWKPGAIKDRYSISHLSLSHEQLAGTLGERVEAARPRLLRLAQLNGMGPEETEDVVQETFLEAWLQMENLREPERFSAWLDGICRNVCKRHIRGRATLLPTSELSTSEEDGDALAFDLPDPFAIDPAEELERQDMQVLLDRALGHLSHAHRKVIELCYLAELPQREVAGLLDMSLGALELKLHRARRQLRQIFHGKLRDDAQAFGLLLDRDEAMGWQQMRSWCWGCGKQRVRAMFEQQPSGINIFRLRCPDCSARYDVDIIHTGELQLLGTMPSFRLVGAMHSFRPALKRTMLDVHKGAITVFGQRRCPICQSTVQIDLIDRNTPHNGSTVSPSLPAGVLLRVACSNCQPYICGISSVLWMNQCVYTFLLERRRVLYTPAVMDTYAGQDAIRSRLLDLNTGERLTIMTHPQTLQTMATIFEK